MDNPHHDNFCSYHALCQGAFHLNPRAGVNPGHPPPQEAGPTSHTPPSLMNFSFCWTFPFPFHEGRHERNAITIELGKKRKAFFGLKEKISKKTFRYYIYILHYKSGTADPLLLEKLLPLREFSLFIRYVFIRPFPLILTLDLCSQEY